jgi:FtsZ-binding cell division protein ZapB
MHGNCRANALQRALSELLGEKETIVSMNIKHDELKNETATVSANINGLNTRVGNLDQQKARLKNDSAALQTVLDGERAKYQQCCELKTELQTKLQEKGHGWIWLWYYYNIVCCVCLYNNPNDFSPVHGSIRPERSSTVLGRSFTKTRLGYGMAIFLRTVCA